MVFTLYLMRRSCRGNRVKQEGNNPLCFKGRTWTKRFKRWTSWTRTAEWEKAGRGEVQSGGFVRSYFQSICMFFIHLWIKAAADQMCFHVQVCGRNRSRSQIRADSGSTDLMVIVGIKSELNQKNCWSFPEPLWLRWSQKNMFCILYVTFKWNKLIIML